MGVTATDTDVKISSTAGSFAAAASAACTLMLPVNSIVAAIAVDNTAAINLFFHSLILLIFTHYVFLFPFFHVYL